MHDLPTGPGGETTPISVPNRAPYDAIERGSFLFKVKGSKVNLERLDTDECPNWSRHFLKNQKSLPDLDIVAGVESEIFIPRSKHGFMMTPIEASTGTPLPIISPESVESNETDEHHSYFRHKLFKASPGLVALRLSRVQDGVDQETHRLFHNYFFRTAYPASEAEVYRQVIRNCAGYVPEFGIAFEDKRTVIRPLRAHERRTLRAPGTFYAEYNTQSHTTPSSHISDYVLRHALGSGITSLGMQDVEEFLSISNQNSRENPALKDRKFKLGMEITKHIISISTEGLQEEFRIGHKAESFMESTQATCPVTVVMAQIQPTTRAYIPNLDRALKESLERAS